MRKRRDGSESLVLLYVTCGSSAEANRIGCALIDGRLAACVNVLGPIRAIYRWQGRLCKGREVALIAKTLATRVPAAIKSIRLNHSYESPCIVELPIQGGDQAFLEWVQRESSAPASKT